MRFDWVIFLVAFGFSLVDGVLSNSFLFLERMFSLTSQMFMWAIQLVNIVGFLISPLVLFFSFYLIGRNVDFAARFQSVLVSLFLGSWIGHLLGYFSLMLWYSSAYGGSFLLWPYVLWQIFWTLVTLAFSLEFFAGLSALAIAYIVKRR